MYLSLDDLIKTLRCWQEAHDQNIATPRSGTYQVGPTCTQVPKMVVTATTSTMTRKAAETEWFRMEAAGKEAARKEAARMEAAEAAAAGVGAGAAVGAGAGPIEAARIEMAEEAARVEVGAAAGAMPL